MGTTPSSTPIPSAQQATQVPPPQGALQRWAYDLLGPSYRTSLYGFLVAAAMAAGVVQTSCPNLMMGKWDKAEAWKVFWTLTASGGLMKFANAAKDKSATGVEK